jgi:hypothetical protein
MRHFWPYTIDGLGFSSLVSWWPTSLWFLVTISWVPPALWIWSLVLGPWLAINAGLWSLPHLLAYCKRGVGGCTLTLLILTIMGPTLSEEFDAITFSAKWAFWIGTFPLLARSSSPSRGVRSDGFVP